MAEIGATLREARMRERIDVSEIEAQTKIRAKYLRALENEEWDLLPGPTFVKSFLRTYGQALGLDGRALVEEYRLHHEHPREGPELDRRPVVQPANQHGAQPGAGGVPISSHAARRRAGRPAAHPHRAPRAGASRAYVATVSVVGAVIVLLLYALLSGGGKSPTSGPPPGASRVAGTSSRHVVLPGASAVVGRASLRLEPTGEVYVCLIGDGRRRIGGLILTPESRVETYHARRFELTLGNDAVRLVVNGTPHAVPASSRAIGYRITRAGIAQLPASEQPTCK